MKKLTKNLISVILVAVMALSALLPFMEVDAAISYSSSKNSGERDEVCTSLDGTGAEDYYSGSYSYESLEDLSSSMLLSTLRTLMKSTHKKQTSYSECKSYSYATDCQNEDGTVVLLYTSYVASMSNFSGSSPGWNREHVWPKSLGGFETSGAGSDLHHIRPDNVKTNSTRGNKKFGNVTGGSQAYADALVGTSVSGGTYSGNYFEPHDNVKGDVARICLYVYVRWGGEYSKCQNITNVFESVDTLLEWCELDPVDTWEMGRNEVVEAIQGNRNVFIDYPELAWLLFDREIPDDMVTPSGKAMDSSDGPDTPVVCTHANTRTEGAVKPTCGEEGYSGDVVCTACGETVSAGHKLAATAEHDYGPIETVTPPTETEDGEGVKTCKVCGDTEKVTIPATGSDGTDTPEDCTHVLTHTEGYKAPTCGDAGYTGDTVCDGCGETVTEGSAIPATGAHVYRPIEIVTPPTESEDGIGRIVCGECSESITVTIPATGSGSGNENGDDIPSATFDELLLGIEDETERLIIMIYLGIIDREMCDVAVD